MSCNTTLAELASCTTQLANVSDALDLSQGLLANCTAALDPCGDTPINDYNAGLHIAAVFIVLVASSLGAGIPILSVYVPFLRVNPYVVNLGKCMGIGVVIACALVHMLQPGNQSLTSPCVPWEFNTDYNAYAFLYCMLAALAMQFLDYVVVRYLTQREHEHQERLKAEQLPLEKGADPERDGSAAILLTDANGKAANAHGANGMMHEPHAHVHSHGILLNNKALKTIEAYMLEFGVTTHSVFIGLAVGVTDNTTLHFLLVALVFHQFFEGVALGSRIADAKLSSHWNEFLLTLIFSVASPIGIGIGIAVILTLNPNGETFLMVQGTFDSWCSGILLYIGFCLLLKDFPEDMDRYCRGQKHENYMRAGMFCFLWLGAGLMAYIGKYL